jgi:hypothetical protein
VRDPTNATYPWRMYYSAVGDKGSNNASHLFTCLALSSDGKKWTKPSLGVATYEGSTDNNVSQAALFLALSKT